ncbi:MAG TPA: hypothetical protein VJ347_21950, partial [Streptosporangiaceae bacterium]|nr:hypothetical protein [Streptosporangiaceae bacterium]
MTLPRTTADVLSEHVVFEVESVDRMYLNVYQPKLQYGGGVSAFFVGHRGHKYASSVLMAPITEAFVANIHHFIAARGVDLVSFGKGQDKDAIAHRYLAGFSGTDGVLFVGRAQEKAWVFRTQKRRNPATGKEYLWLTRATLQVNYFYFYCVDDDFGPFFIKFCSYFPYGAKLCINGNHWAQRQAEKAGIGFTPMDNAFAAVDDVPALQAICDCLGEEHIRALLDKWLRILSHPFTEDDIAAGYCYDVSVVQAEFSLTQMLDKPVTGRIFLEQMIRDNLDLGRPDKISLIFGRRIHNGRKRPTPSQFRTRIVTDNVTPAVRVEYKKTKVKQYHKEGRALRTETVINDPGDFGIGKGLGNLPALRQVGFTANRRLLGVQKISHDPAAGAAAITAITSPVTTPSGTRVAGLRFTDERVQALLSALCAFRLLPNGFTNRELRAHLAPLLGRRYEDMTSGQITYDLTAPRGALSYPRFSREELGRRFLGLMAYSRSER